MRTRHLATLALSLFAINNGAFAAKLPPNSIDLANYANGMVGGTGASPVISNTPIPIQPQIAPSQSTVLQQQIDEYQQSQLTPSQMQALKEAELTNARITSTPYLSNPEPIVRTLAVNLNPGETPPILRLSKDMLTTIVFTDNEGNPFYIEKIALNRNKFSDSVSVPAQGNMGGAGGGMQNNMGNTSGADPNNPQSTQVMDNGTGTANSAQAPTIKPTNILTIEPLEAVSYGTMSVTLKGKSMPIIFLLTTGQNSVDVRVDARIPGRSPDAPYRVGSFAAPAPDIDTNALAILDGAIPADAISLISSDSAASGWEYNDSLYVKTRLDVLYPAYMSKASTPDGLNIYRFPAKTNNSVTFMQRQGQPVTVTFEESPYSQYER